jgi:hypothetical protein
MIPPIDFWDIVMGKKFSAAGAALIAAMAAMWLPGRAAADASVVIDPGFFSSAPGSLALAAPDPRVSLAATPEGSVVRYAPREVIVRADDPEALERFLARVGGVVLPNGASVHGGSAGAAANPFVLVRIDPALSPVEGLAEDLTALGVEGRTVFSSPEAAATAALIARQGGVEGEVEIWPNLMLDYDATLEHPRDDGTFEDAETWPWMTEDDDPGLPGEQGLSVGTVHAWRYLRYLGVPPTDGPFEPPVVAIIDGGFAMEPDGAPSSGNLDYFPSVPPQFDLIDFDGSADGPNLRTCTGGTPCPWHGTGAFGVALARHSNQFGGAGSAGNVAWPMLVRQAPTLFGTADAIRTAALNGADVISISSGGGCLFEPWLCDIPPDDFRTVMQSAVDLATTLGAVVLASAGNEGEDVAGKEKVPCKLERVICVGSVNGRGMNVFNFGAAVDIWAPTGLFSTVTPDSAPDLDRFGGTSASTPFVAGIVALMKALDPDLRWNEVQAILQDTANPSADPRVTHGYVDAYRAVRAVRDHAPPTLAVLSPAEGDTLSYRGRSFRAEAADPESDDPETGRVAWASDRDGALCEVSGFHFAALSGRCRSDLTPGPHVLTVVATDRHEGSATATLRVEAVNSAPTIEIGTITPGTDVFSHQEVTLFALANDVDEGPPFAQDRLRWTSSLDGDLGTGTGLAVSLSAGDHLVTAEATDELGLTDSDIVAIRVRPGAGVPSVEILSPTAGLVAPGTNVAFAASATDPEDGPLGEGSLVWSSSRDGQIGTGAQFGAVLSGPATACNPETVRHVISLSVTDSDDNTVTETTRIAVGRVC